MSNVKIETERLIIRNFTVNDWKPLQEMIVQKESSEYAIYDHQWPTTEKEIKGITQWFASGNSYFAVCLKNTNPLGFTGLIGFIALNNIEGEDKAFDLGYCFNFDYHGKGYATEGCKALLKYAFLHWKTEKILCSTAAANGPSCKLLRRLGMKKTKEETTSFRKTSEGKPIEFLGVTFDMTRDEWLEINS